MEYGYIYVIRLNVPDSYKKRSSKLKPYKIGKSKYPEQRLSSISNSVPYDIEVIMLEGLNNYGKFEKILHEQFNKQRIKGEWFSLSYSDIGVLKILYDEFNKDNILFVKELNDLKLQSKKISENIKLVKCINCRKPVKSYKNSKQERKFCCKSCRRNYSNDPSSI